METSFSKKFRDTREFVTRRWDDISTTAKSRLSTEDQKFASDYLYWQDIHHEVQAKLNDSSSTQIMKRQMNRILSFPGFLAKLTMNFERLTEPIPVNFEILWGLIYLNLKERYDLKRTRREPES